MYSIFSDVLIFFEMGNYINYKLRMLFFSHLYKTV
jgi:hypothetical protein